MSKKYSTYIDQIAYDIALEHDDLSTPSPDYVSLYRIYAVLALAKGEATTLEDVHDAWSAWRAETDPEHRSLVPFTELSHEVQELDRPYCDAIRTVARTLDTSDRI